MFNFINYQQLHRDIIRLSQIVPPEVCTVYGVPRSGSLVANLFALHRNISLNGKPFRRDRDLGYSGVVLNNRRKLKLIIDDCTDTGDSLQAYAEKIGGDYITAALYVNPAREFRPDYYVEKVPKPRFCEWNMMGHGEFTHHAMMDIDGLLCEDPTIEENDDGNNYFVFLNNAAPKYIPSRHVLYLCTNRLHKYRKETEAWLAKHGIKYTQLFMSPWDSQEERRRVNKYAHFKADTYKFFDDAWIFFESDQRQANEINQLTHKPVLCTETMELLQDPF